jgi:ABC-type glycerol-3-phosphate transport system substrate-binding protein
MKRLMDSGLSRREFLRWSALASAGLVAAGCVPAQTPAPAPTTTEAGEQVSVAEQATIEFWQFWCAEEGKKKWMDATTEAYAQTNPGVTINATCYDKDPLFQAMRTAFEAGEGPDTFYFDPYPYHDIDWVNKGFLADLSPYLDSDRYVPGYFDPLAYNDAVYGVPVEGYVMNMWYNENIFDELGLQVPDSREVELDEFEEWCRKIKADAGIAPMANAFMDLHHYASVHVGCMLYRYLGLDGYKALGRGELAWTELEVKEAVARAESWFKEGFVNVDAGGISTPDSYSLMFQSKAAMNYRGGWILGQSRNDPEKGGAPEGVTINFFRFPILPGGPGNNIVDGGTGGCFGVSAQSKVLETTAEPF